MVAGEQRLQVSGGISGGGAVVLQHPGVAVGAVLRGKLLQGDGDVALQTLQRLVDRDAGGGVLGQYGDHAVLDAALGHNRLHLRGDDVQLHILLGQNADGFHIHCRFPSS